MRFIRLGLGVFFLLLVIEGALRKWVWPGQQQVIYLAKDAVLTLTLLVYFFRAREWRPRGLRGSIVGVVLLYYAAWVALEMLNPALPNSMVGLLGFKSHVLYSAFLLLIPAAFRNGAELVRWVNRYLLLAIPVFVLGLVQFFSPVTSVLNRYAGVEDVREVAVMSGKFVRITGTFPFISGMVTFLFAILLTAICLLAARGFSTRTVTTAAIIALGVCITPMTGTRWAVYIWAIVLPLVFWDSFAKQPGRFRKVIMLAAVVGVSVVVFSRFGGTGLTAFTQRARTAGDDRTRIDNVLTQPYTFSQKAGLLGFGSGATHQAAPQLAPGVAPYSWLPDDQFEDEPGRVVLELGVIGFLVFCALKVSLWWYARKAVGRLAGREERALASAASIFMLAHFTTPIIFNVTAGALFWAFAGIVVALVGWQETERGAPARAGRATVVVAPVRRAVP